MVQRVRTLVHKFEDLSSNPLNSCKSQELLHTLVIPEFWNGGMMRSETGVCGGIEEVGEESLGLASHQWSYRFRERSCLSISKKQGRE